jgi:hypothetical protein
MSLFSSVVGACLVTGLMLSLMARLMRAATWSAGLVALILREKFRHFCPLAPPTIFYVVIATTLGGLYHAKDWGPGASGWPAASGVSM